MQKIYSRIEEEFYTLKECQDFIFEIKNNGENKIEWSEVANLDLDECCEILNHEDVFGCGTCYYVVDENINHSELLKLMYN